MTKKISITCFFLFTLCFISLMPTFGAESKDIQVQQSFQAIQNPEPDFGITVWVDHESNTYNIGESITFYFKSNRDCYVHLLDIGTSGKVTLIYPNQFATDNFIKGGQTYKLPAPETFQFVASGPEGTEMVKAIATLKRTDLANLPGARNAGAFKAFDKDGTVVAKDIQVTLNQTPPKQWAEYGKVIKIVRKNSGPVPVSETAPAPQPQQSYTAFGTTLWTSKHTYRAGASVRFFFTTNRDAYVTLVSIGTSGEVRILFPNRFSQNNYCTAGTTYTIPGENAPEKYVVTGPSGTETVKIIAAQNQFSLSASPYDYTKSAYPALAKTPEQVTKDIEVISTSESTGRYFDEATMTIQIIQ
ncbi:exported hypothetical protein [Desulfamplus magnetovallimortis]|uniref:DUF4384 domain-containing protein n=1 Tax=Desulfamplus magnetovallimortis TaxID=1246637 RepID=A0A1W1H4V4_9BACT|nr:DUF4384 domain-containing protein [Desulfamplus magnetovallimortis]SLM27486.1 exported hypothetical protein [Desulfamplus magnetovallimortis]